MVTAGDFLYLCQAVLLLYRTGFRRQTAIAKNPETSLPNIIGKASFGANCILKARKSPTVYAAAIRYATFTVIPSLSSSRRFTRTGISLDVERNRY